MLAAIGTLLLLAGISLFILGLIRRFFPSTESVIPNNFKKVINIRLGVYVFLAGLLLVRFF